jgi:hypothetical protein
VPPRKDSGRFVSRRCFMTGEATESPNFQIFPNYQREDISEIWQFGEIS